MKYKITLQTDKTKQIFYVNKEEFDKIEILLIEGKED